MRQNSKKNKTTIKRKSVAELEKQLTVGVLTMEKRSQKSLANWVWEQPFRPKITPEDEDIEEWEKRSQESLQDVVWG